MQYNDLQYELHYIAKEQENILSENFFNIRNQDKDFYFKRVTLDDIDSLTKDSPVHLLRALYTCKPFTICKENNESFLNKNNVSKILGYKSEFANIFIFNKDSLNNNYLTARKALYHSLSQIKQERLDYYQQGQTRISQLNYEEYQEELRQQRNQRNKFNPHFYNKDTNQIILQSQDKNITILFLDKVNLKDLESLNTKDSKQLDSFISMSNLLHLHNNKIDIFTKDKSVINIQALAENYKDYNITLETLNSPNTQIFLYSHLLLGSKELPNNPLFFGELDKDNSIKQDSPSFYFSPKDESSGLGKLSIFYKNNTLYLLNYSIKENSLNIKLECLNKQSLEYKDLISNIPKDKEHSNLNASQSIATLHALLENQQVQCLHGGVVILKSHKGKTFKDNGIPLILESDLLNSPITNCPHTIAGIPNPCTKVASVKGSLSKKKVNGEFAILQELINSCKSDKGVGLKVEFKPTKFKFDDSLNPKESVGNTKEHNTELKEPAIRLYYKEHKYQRDNLLITRLFLNDTLRENQEGFEKLELTQSDLLDLDNTQMLNTLKQDFNKEYDFKKVKIRLGVHLLNLIFVIAKKIPKIYQEAYRDYEYKDLGVGYFKQLHSYDKDYRDNELIIHNRIFLSPSKMQTMNLQIARGLDDWLSNGLCGFCVYTNCVYSGESNV
ncbi:lipase [Helicobacter sp. 14348-15]|uniref:lipase n=1 Tax=Helicobacter colisuis TaxID=2949739 RepID=UPI00202B6E8D|nr:lipase [Helicobacter colisuis]MCL9821802.1 lipase [Helicobacter colisuis]